MILYMTRRSLFDTADDFDLQMTAQMYKESRAIINDLCWDGEQVLPENHPTLRMWEGHELALCAYAQVMEIRLTQFGINKDIGVGNIRSTVAALRKDGLQLEKPDWFGDLDVLRSHRSNMARRWPERFGKTWANTPERLPYLWPVEHRILLSKDDKARLASGERVLPENMKERIDNLA